MPAGHRGPGLKKALKAHPSLSLIQEAGAGENNQGRPVVSSGFLSAPTSPVPPGMTFISLPILSYSHCGSKEGSVFFSSMLLVKSLGEILHKFPYDLLLLINKQNIPRIFFICPCCCVLNCAHQNSHSEA
jgi:hypothetical protein